jgi:hypothetical protein
MIAAEVPSVDPRIDAAIGELQHLIAERFPDATFAVGPGEETGSVHLVATVDIEDPDEVIDVVIDRLVALHVDERVPVFLVPVRPLARVLTMLDAEEGRAPTALPG